jgi:hypothetical protein
MNQFEPYVYFASRMLFLMLIIWILPDLLTAGQIDIGIFESDQENRMEIKIRPDFGIEADKTITCIRYTIRWAETDMSITNHSISPYNMSPDGAPVYHDGYYYQKYVRVISSSVGTAIEAGEERLIAAFSYPEDYCCQFEIIEDEWTENNLGNLIVELQGTIVTGIIYEPLVDLRPQGGIAIGGSVIDPGEDTGTLSLHEYDGNVMGWQRRLNERDWETIPDTEGLTAYSEMPESPGNWYYRAIVNKPNCEEVYSEPTLVQLFKSEVNIGIYHAGNGLFEVRLKPYQNIEAGISNIQFALKWPEETVELYGFESNHAVEMQYSAVHEGFNYAVFVSVPEENHSLNWLAAEEYNILQFRHDESGNSYADFTIAQEQWAVDNNAEFYTELWGENITGDIYHQAQSVFTGISRSLIISVLLEGPYDISKGMMRNHLNDQGFLPNDQPYNVQPWEYPGEEHAITFHQDIVDWILLEVIDAESALQASTKSPVLKKALLLKKDGSLVNHEMKTPSMILENDIEDGLFVIIRHRNHIDILSNDALSFDESNRTFSRNFTNSIDASYKGEAGYKQIHNAANIFGMVAGDADSDGDILPADRSIFRQTFGSSGYKKPDFDFDGEVLPSDRSLFRNNFGISNPL